jgi:hypothetical protein
VIEKIVFGAAVILALLYPPMYNFLSYILAFAIGGVVFYHFGKEHGEKEERERIKHEEQLRKRFGG